ncbi:MAG: protease pro-enzyme activation domain-containing protein [Bryobacteraceae bacterium]
MRTLQRVGYLICSLGLLSYAQPTGHPARMITGTIDGAKLRTLEGNTRPEANALNDRGIVADDFKVDHMLLQLKRSPEREAALKQYIEDLHNPKSANFHKWLTPDQFAEHYGIAQEDVATVKSWLASQGFTIHGVQTSGLTMDFSGTAGLVRSAFHTEIHNLEVDGKQHFANVSDPRIPEGLTPAVAGVVSMHNFHPKPALVPRGQYTFTNSNGTFHGLVPGDIQTVYNMTPVYQAGFTGLGQTIMVVEDTYLYSVNDWTIFRKTFGLTRPYPHATLSQVSPTGAITCTNPGFQGSESDPGFGDDGEAAIDVEWASAAAPNAAIVLAACTDTTAFGGLIALENTLNGPVGSLPTVVSISYGEAEAANGATANLAYFNAYQQAVSEGVSIFVSSGDELAASDDGGNTSTHGISISGFTSTPYNVSVGGLDFGYTANSVNPSTYWNSTNSSTYSSALSYIQEIPWNNSCANSLLAPFLAPLLGTPADPLTFCNTTTANSDGFRNAVGGSGGPSGCATGTATTRGVVSGTCAGYSKPSFQSGLLGNPTDGVRDIPDVALFASNGFWDAYYVVCWSNPNTNPEVGGGFTCTGAPSTWAGFGGTSVSSPIMAGIQSLVNQKTGSTWGNPNTTYYTLANIEYATAGTASACNSNTVNKFSNTCIFYDITQGDIDGACKASGTTLRNCYRPSPDTIGILSTSNTASQPAYTTNTGWDFASGIGSVNAYNLVFGWPIVP